MELVLAIIGAFSLVLWARRAWKERSKRKFLEEHLGPYAGLTWQPRKSRLERKIEKQRKELGY